MVSRILLTQSAINAAGQDAGNRSMRKAGRTRWNRADAMVAQAEIARLLPYWMADTFGMSLESARARVAKDFA